MHLVYKIEMGWEQSPLGEVVIVSGGYTEQRRPAVSRADGFFIDRHFAKIFIFQNTGIIAEIGNSISCSMRLQHAEGQ